MSTDQGQTLQLIADDGVTLAASRFGREDAEHAVLVCAATGVPRTFYRAFAQALSTPDVAVYTLDYRGIGDSRAAGALRQCHFTMADWGALDLEALLRHAARRHRALYAVTHSVGGQVLPLAPSAPQLRGLFTVATQSGYWKHWPAPRHLLMAALWWGVIPVLTPLLGYAPGRMYGGEDLPPRVVQQWARWGRHPEYVLSYSETIKQRFAAVDAPVTAVSLDDDPLAPRDAVDALMQHYGGPLTRRHIHPADIDAAAIGHFGFFRRGATAALWPLVTDAFGLDAPQPRPG